MREQEGTKENTARLAQAVNRVVGILEGRTVANQWIRRSVFERWIEGLERKTKRVKAQNATLCWWLRPELRALGASIRKLKKTATEKHRHAANERYVEQRLQNADADPVLKGLHPAQQRAVVVAEDTQLVLAGAGTGKTQTMAAKVADTLRLGRTTPEHVAVVTFTNKAAGEIRERIAKLAGQPTKGMFVGTIHGLAKQVLAQAPGAGGARIDAIAEPSRERYQALERMLDCVMKADASLHEALAVRAQAHVRIPPSDGKRDEKVRVSLRTGTIDVRSHGEAAICRVLDERGIAFAYEAAYVETPPDEDERKQEPKAAKVKDECLESGYRPDFKITLDEGAVVWLEHWGVDGKGSPPKGWDEEDRRRYVEGMRWKRHTHEVLGTRLAETSWGQYAEALRGERDWASTVVEAIARATGQDPGSIDERFARRDDGWTPEAETIRVLVQEVSEWIGAAGRCGLEEADIGRRIEGMDVGSTRDEAQALAVLAKAVRARYEAHLEEAGTTDFEKMVLDAARALEAGKTRPGFEQVIVDEWQDVNGAQERFVRALSRHGGAAGKRPTLCVVGDDWQSIYGFQGGDPGYTRDFPEKGDACERTDLDRTWRFGKRRAHATRKWALGDAKAVDKQVEGDEGKDSADAVTEIVGRTITAAGAERLGGSAGEESAETAIRGILEKIGGKEHGRGESTEVLLLARRRNTVADSKPLGGRGSGQGHRRVEDAALADPSRGERARRRRGAHRGVGTCPAAQGGRPRPPGAASRSPPGRCGTRPRDDDGARGEGPGGGLRDLRARERSESQGRATRESAQTCAAAAAADKRERSGRGAQGVVRGADAGEVGDLRSGAAEGCGRHGPARRAMARREGGVRRRRGGTRRVARAVPGRHELSKVRRSGTDRALGGAQRETGRRRLRRLHQLQVLGRRRGGALRTHGTALSHVRDRRRAQDGRRERAMHRAGVRRGDPALQVRDPEADGDQEKPHDG